MKNLFISFRIKKENIVMIITLFFERLRFENVPKKNPFNKKPLVSTDGPSLQALSVTAFNIFNARCERRAVAPPADRSKSKTN